jgi:hypothetical protein
MNLKMLERSLDQHQEARRTFFRDLKIVGAAVLAFQFMVFFRFVNLSEQQHQLGGEIADARTNLVAVQEIQTQLALLQSALRTNTAALLAELNTTPLKLRNQILDLERDLNIFRGAPSLPGATALPSPPGGSSFQPIQMQAPPVQMQMQAPVPNAAFSPMQQRLDLETPAPGFAFLAGLNTNEIQSLHDGSPNDGAFQQIVTSLVERDIIKPKFQELDETRRNLLLQPFARGQKSLLALTNSWAILERNGVHSENLRTNLEQVFASMSALRFDAPKTSDWWQTFGGKESFIGERRLNVENITMDAQTALLSPAREFDLLANQMAGFIHQDEERQKEFAAALTALETRAGAIQSLLESYSKPMAALTLEPRQVMLYYPVVLAGLFCAFVIRFWLLQKRALWLANAYRQLGVTSEVLEACFNELLTLRKSVFNSGKGRIAFLMMLLVIPPALFVASVLWIFGRASFLAEIPAGFYVIAGTCIAAGIAFAIRSAARSAPLRENKSDDRK